MKGINREDQVIKPSDFITIEDGKMYFTNEKGDKIEVPTIEDMCSHLDSVCKWKKPTGEVVLTIDVLMKKFMIEDWPRRLYATKKIKVTLEEVINQCKIIYEGHMVFNSLDEFTTQLWGRDLKDIPVLSELSGWVNAESYREIPGDRRTKNCSIRRDANKPDSFFVLYMNALAFVRGIHRLGANDNVVTLDTLKSPKSISDVIHKVVVFESDEYFIHYEGVDFIPIQLDLDVFERYNESWFNFDASIVLDNYLTQLYR